MSEQIVLNPRILDKIDQLEADEQVRQFLKEILSIELDSFEAGVVKFSDNYTRCIDKYLPKTGRR